MNQVGSLIVSWDFSHDKDKWIFLVGEQVIPGHVEIVNAFQGKDAEDIYNKLITKKGEKNND